MSFYKQTLEVLDKLSINQQDIAEYIKSFGDDPAFMYAEETDPVRIALQIKMKKLDDGTHSGASWGYMLRTVQSVLRGVNSYEEIVIAKNQQEERYRQLMEEDEAQEQAYKQMQAQAKQAQAKQAQAQQAQAQQAQAKQAQAKQAQAQQQL